MKGGDRERAMCNFLLRISFNLLLQHLKNPSVTLFPILKEKHCMNYASSSRNTIYKKKVSTEISGVRFVFSAILIVFISTWIENTRIHLAHAHIARRHKEHIFLHFVFPFNRPFFSYRRHQRSYMRVCEMFVWVCANAIANIREEKSLNTRINKTFGKLSNHKCVRKRN